MPKNLTIINAGCNGHNTADLLFRLQDDVLSYNPQLVILMVGTNDMLNLVNILSVEEYEANYQRLIDQITRHAQLIMMTIPPVDSDSILRRVNIDLYKNVNPDVLVDSANEAVKRLATKNNCLLIDLHHILQACGGATADAGSLFMNEANTGIGDGVHPTVQGYRVIGTAVFNAVNKYAPDAERIVCLGDSITRGYLVPGEGTTTGDTYPAVLKRLMN